MKRAMILGCAVGLALGAMAGHAAARGIQMTVPCQESLDDGRILLDGNYVPRNARYNVVHYHPASSGDGWTHGTCDIVVTKGASS